MTFDPCRPVREHLSDELDGEALPLHVRAMMGVHLSICPPCQRTHRSLLAVKEALLALRDEDVPASLYQAAPPPPEE
jgi:predicted anti-sigma-YlaC factor YlaD